MSEPLVLHPSLVVVQMVHIELLHQLLLSCKLQVAGSGGGKGGQAAGDRKLQGAAQQQLSGKC